MDLDEILNMCKEYRFTQLETHLAMSVARTASKEYSTRHPRDYNSMDSRQREAYEEAIKIHAVAVGRQYILQEVDKWHRRGYKKLSDNDATGFK